MARKLRIKPRKAASQQRSRETVKTLLDATARILVKEGLDKASTNRIAAVAGVSIGSLYQYFPSKEALVAAVIERHQQEIMQTVRGELADIWRLPVDEAIREIVAVAVKAHRVDPELHRALERVPRVGKLEKLATFNRENYTLFRNFLETHRHLIPIADPDLAAFVCVTSIEALTHNAVLDDTQLFANDRMETLIDEGARLVMGYLRGSVAPAERKSIRAR